MTYADETAMHIMASLVQVSPWGHKIGEGDATLELLARTAFKAALALDRERNRVLSTPEGSSGTSAEQSP